MCVEDLACDQHVLIKHIKYWQVNHCCHAETLAKSRLTHYTRHYGSRDTLYAQRQAELASVFEDMKCCSYCGVVMLAGQGSKYQTPCEEEGVPPYSLCNPFLYSYMVYDGMWVVCKECDKNTQTRQVGGAMRTSHRKLRGILGVVLVHKSNTSLCVCRSDGSTLCHTVWTIPATYYPFLLTSPCFYRSPK
jgi:hypothetical protein